jgi:methylthioribose-1-phosphate isomerase
MAFLASIRTSEDDIEIVNQLLLPHTTEWLPINSIEETHEAIKSMKAHLPFPTFHISRA